MTDKPTRGPSLPMPKELHSLARGAVKLVTTVTGRPYTLAQLGREAVAEKIQQISRDYNDGKPIEPDEAPRPAGRPASS